MEALVFRCFTTAAGFLLAWIAVLSFWHFLSVCPKPITAALRPSPPLTSPSLQQPNSPTPCIEPRHQLAAITGDGGGDLKGRYTAYFKAEMWISDADGSGSGAGVASVKTRRHEGLVMRRGDLGWYRYQDLSVLNGSIVRLWDGELPAQNGSCRIGGQYSLSVRKTMIQVMTYSLLH